MKLDSLMEKWKKVTASAAEKTKARAEILNDIYRERKGTTYDLVSQKQLMMLKYSESIVELKT